MSPKLPETHRLCFRAPVPEIAIAAGYLSEALAAHLAADFELAADLIRRADIPVIAEWTESLWGKASPYVQYRKIDNAPPSLSKLIRQKLRMPDRGIKAALLGRDGHHCRFCSVPVIRAEVRMKMAKAYPDALRWSEASNTLCHTAFQAMLLQYDHLLPHSRGGDNSLDNMVVTCAPCNFSRMSYTLEEVGLANPLLRPPLVSNWDGLEGFV